MLVDAGGRSGPAWSVTACSSSATFGPYVEGHRVEVAAQVAELRAFLLELRDRELLERAPHDRAVLRTLLGPVADLPGEERGRL